MKIGILIGDFATLKNYELRIIDALLNDPLFEICLLIQDGRSGEHDQASTKNTLKRLFSSKGFLGRILFKIQVLIERKILFKEKYSIDRNTIIDKLNAIDLIKAQPTRKGFVDYFEESDVQKIKARELDVILRHEFNIIRGDVLAAATYGIWSFHHADNAINRGGPPGFWEIVLKQSSIGVTLQQLTPELDGGLVIDKAFFNLHWSYIATYDSVLEGSVSLLLKNLRKLAAGEYQPQKSLVYYNPLYKAPGLYYCLYYILHFYFRLLEKTAERIRSKLFGTRYNCWSLFIGQGEFMTAALFRLKPVKLPKYEFWADPFIFNHQGTAYVFFENYDYRTKRGKISCGRVENHNLVDIQDTLVTPYHLSYPYIFEENNKIYLMPESNENNCLEIYECIEFPHKWQLFATAFEGEKILDAFFFDDDKNQKWLFLNKHMTEDCPPGCELYIYKVDSLKMENLIPHKNNPVLIDSRTARNGGAIFKHENSYFRPSQANIDGIYGAALNINRITKLSLEEYAEETLIRVKPNFYEGLISIHHLHQTDNFFVIDAAFMKK